MRSRIIRISCHALLGSVVVMALIAPAHADPRLKQGEKAPAFTLPTVAAERHVDLETTRLPAIVLFGEPYHQQTQESLVALKKIYKELELTETDLPVFLVLSQNPTPEEMVALQEQEKIRAEVLLDKELSAFGDYGVVVLPTVVVIDRLGRISLFLSGYSLFFQDLVEDAILLAMGRITQEQFDSSRFVSQENAGSEAPVRRAWRLTGLAEQLMRRNYCELALQRYREALTLDSTYLPAKIGMARCFVRLNLLPEAEHQLQEVLEADARHLEANLIIAHVEILRGGEEIQAAEDRLERILAATPTHPEAHYMLGLAYEAQGQKDLALSHYKKAAQYLLETSSL